MQNIIALMQSTIEHSPPLLAMASCLCCASNASSQLVSPALPARPAIKARRHPCQSSAALSWRHACTQPNSMLTGQTHTCSNRRMWLASCGIEAPGGCCGSAWLHPDRGLLLASGDGVTEGAKHAVQAILSPAAGLQLLRMARRQGRVLRAVGGPLLADARIKQGVAVTRAAWGVAAAAGGTVLPELPKGRRVQPAAVLVERAVQWKVEQQGGLCQLALGKQLLQACKISGAAQPWALLLLSALVKLLLWLL